MFIQHLIFSLNHSIFITSPIYYIYLILKKKLHTLSGHIYKQK